MSRFFGNLFVTKKQTPQTFLLLECMDDGHNGHDFYNVGCLPHLDDGHDDNEKCLQAVYDTFFLILTNTVYTLAALLTTQQVFNYDNDDDYNHDDDEDDDDDVDDHEYDVEDDDCDDDD